MVFANSDKPVALKYADPKPLHVSGHTTFSFEGKNYDWKGRSQLTEESTGAVLAKYYTSSEDKLGTLVVNQPGIKMLDLIVITCLIDNERYDAERWKVSNSTALVSNHSLSTDDFKHVMPNRV